MGKPQADFNTSLESAEIIDAQASQLAFVRIKVCRAGSYEAKLMKFSITSY
jgi:hypothetical protein